MGFGKKILCGIGVVVCRWVGVGGATYDALRGRVLEFGLGVLNPVPARLLLMRVGGKMQWWMSACFGFQGSVQVVPAATPGHEGLES